MLSFGVKQVYEPFNVIALRLPCSSFLTHLFDSDTEEKEE
jgi:hypothetical protein